MGRRKILAGFNPSVYTKSVRISPWQDPTLHFISSGCPSGPWARRVISDASPTVKFLPEIKAALHIHVYYPDLLTKVIRALETNHTKPALFISLAKGVEGTNVNRVITSYSSQGEVILLGKNIGRDLGPFFSHLPTSFFSDFQVTGHLHTKKSEAHSKLRGVAGWFDFCVGNMLGTSDSPGMLDRTLEAFASDERLGIVYPDDPNVMGWTENYQAAIQLLDASKLPGEEELFDFPIGSFFFARPHALKPLLELRLTDKDYPEEPVPYDGTSLHALERLIGVVPKQMGYETAVTFVSSLYR